MGMQRIGQWAHLKEGCVAEYERWHCQSPLIRTPLPFTLSASHTRRPDVLHIRGR